MQFQKGQAATRPDGRAKSWNSDTASRAPITCGGTRAKALEDVRKRFRAMVEDGRADKNDEYIIFRWKW